MSDEPNAAPINNAPAGGVPAAAPAPAATINMNDPAILAAIQTAVDKQVSGLKVNNQSLIDEKRTMKGDYTELQSLVDSFGGADNIKTIMNSVANDKDLIDIKEGRIEDVWERRSQGLQNTFSKKEQTWQEAKAEYESKMENQHGVIRKLTIGADLRAEAVKHGAQPTALEDIERRGLNLFSLNDQNATIPGKDDNGLARVTDTGDPLMPDNFMASLKLSAPHLFAPSSGAGSLGSVIKNPEGKRVVKMSELKDNQAKFEEAVELEQKGELIIDKSA